MRAKLVQRLILTTIILSGVFFLFQLVMMSQSLSDGTVFRASDETNPWQEKGSLVSIIDDRQNELLDGDLILEVESVSLLNWIDRAFCFSDNCSRFPVIQDGTSVNYKIERDGQIQFVRAHYRPYPLWQVMLQSSGSLTFTVGTYIMFLFLMLKQPDEPGIQAMALMASGFLLSSRWLFGISIVDVLNPVSFWVYLFLTHICYIIGSVGFLHFTLVFPKPLPLINRYSWTISFLYLSIYLIFGTLFLIYAFTTANKLLWLAYANILSTFLDTFVSISAVVAIIISYRSLTRDSERQQIQIISFSVMIVMVFALVLHALPQLLNGSKLISTDGLSYIAMLIPVTIVFTIQRHHLWNIDPIINRALVYSSLSAIIMLIYMVTVAFTGELLRVQASSMNGLIATGIVAVIFQPLRERLQKIVNRIMYGERDDPALVLSRLAHHLETANMPSAILPNLVETIAYTLKIPYVAIWLLAENATMEVVAEWGKAPEQREMISLVYYNEIIGNLVVAPRRKNEHFTRDEQTLLTTIATLTATTVRSTQLSDELRFSRQRIVTAREEERRRIRRDLHDGLGPQLASQTLALEAIAQQMISNPEKAQSILESLQAQAHEAISDVRRLVYDLRPPALDDLGLIGALKQTASRYESHKLHFKFEIFDMLPDLPAAIETAVFRITQEAMTNVVRHAEASHCILRLYCTGHDMIVEIEDNGCGLVEGYTPGIGLLAMKERAAELNGDVNIDSLPGGGTLIRTELPLGVYGE